MKAVFKKKYLPQIREILKEQGRLNAAVHRCHDRIAALRDAGAADPECYEERVIRLVFSSKMKPWASRNYYAECEGRNAPITLPAELLGPGENLRHLKARLTGKKIVVVDVGGYQARFVRVSP